MEVERRGITSDKVFKGRSILRLEKNLQIKRKSEMTDDERVRDFQRKLYQKAKQEKDFRFYVLYDKVRQMYFLREAYRRVKQNGGSAGIDGITFDEIESKGLSEYLSSIQKELENFEYRPMSVKRVMIPKANGGERPLGIPIIKDRIIQMSCKMVIEPIFEADFENNSFGFRPKRSAADAIKKIKEYINSGDTEILDADLSKCFDTIPHDKLMILLGKRISDKNVLHLIKMWLKAPVEENNKISGGKSNKIGTPQGSVISPLLANVYLHILDKIVCSVKSVFYKNGIKIVRYADDFILIGKKMSDEIIQKLMEILNRLELKLNVEKTKRLNIKEDSFNFLGFKFQQFKDLFGKDKKYLNISPSEKSLNSIKEKIREYLSENGHKSPIKIVKDMNAKIRGWINYFSIEKVSYPAVSKRKLRFYLSAKLYRFYKRKSQRKSKLCNQGAFQYLVDNYGLIDPTKYFCGRTTVKV